MVYSVQTFVTSVNSSLCREICRFHKFVATEWGLLQGASVSWVVCRIIAIVEINNVEKLSPHFGVLTQTALHSELVAVSDYRTFKARIKLAHSFLTID